MGRAPFATLRKKLGKMGLYLLDEPENSLSPARQVELVQFLTDSVRFFWLPVCDRNACAVYSCVQRGENLRS